MALSLSPETQRLIEQRMKEAGFESADEFLQAELAESLDYEDLDEETKAAIERADAEIERGEGIPLEEARQQFMKKHFGR